MASNPMMQMVMSALQARTAQGGGAPGGAPGGQPGMPPGMPPGGAPGGPGQASGGMEDGGQYAQQVAEMKGANPQMLLEQLKKMKQMVAVLMVQNLERLPNVAGQLSKLVPMFDRVIKEASQAQNAVQAVRDPIGMGQAQAPEQPKPQGF